MPILLIAIVDHAYRGLLLGALAHWTGRLRIRSLTFGGFGPLFAGRRWMKWVGDLYHHSHRWVLYESLFPFLFYMYHAISIHYIMYQILSGLGLDHFSFQFYFGRVRDDTHSNYAAGAFIWRDHQASTRSVTAHSTIQRSNRSFLPRRKCYLSTGSHASHYMIPYFEFVLYIFSCLIEMISPTFNDYYYYN